MGARKKEAPRRGSAGLRPRKRAKSLVPSVRTWPEVQETKPLAFIGYKVGMTHIFMIDDKPGSETYGQEIFVPVTVVETPPMVVLAARAYAYDPNRGLYTLTEVWRDPTETIKSKLGEEVARKYLLGLSKRLPHMIEEKGSGNGFEFKVPQKEFEVDLDKVRSIRLILTTIPFLAGGVEKKAPDIIEVQIGGDISSAYNYAKERLGTLLDVEEVFQTGQFVDVIGVTKGKGFQGVVKRFGVKELPKWHKHRKGSRKIGSRSPGIGTVSYAPQPGQMGFHRRTEYNKRILMISDDPEKINVKGGWLHYGLVRSKYMVIAGTLFGTPKRPLVFRHPIRPPAWQPGVPQITYISLESKQGR